MKRILITGGAGFAGSNLAIEFARNFSGVSIVALDNLKRRGSELNLSRLREYGVEFAHGDVRIRDDILALGAVDLIIDCSAEPSVMAGREGSPEYVIQTNLGGTINCLEAARLHGADLVFLSTSRVYPIQSINLLDYRETETRFELLPEQETRGASEYGISEDFPLDGVRSLYGTTKLSSELLIQEYIDTYGIRAITNRCGVLTGPWQMGKVDQGVVVLWVAKHLFEKSLSYIGYGGSGKQVRDVLHISDLFSLLETQLRDLDRFNGNTFNVGGGREVSTSLLELTDLCRESTGKTIRIDRTPESRPGDLISYVTDYRKIASAANWAPSHSAPSIVEGITRWITDNKDALEPILS